MKHSIIRLSLLLLVIHCNYGFSFPRIDLQHPARVVYKDKDGSTLSIYNSYVEKPTLKEITYYHLVEKPYAQGQEDNIETEDSGQTTGSAEAEDIDPRKDKSDKDSYSTESSDHGKRQKREVSLESNPSQRRPKRYYRTWLPLTPNLSRQNINELPQFLRETLTEQKPIQELRNSKYSYLIGRLPSTLIDEDDEENDDDESIYASSSDESDIWYEEPNIVEYLEYDESDENSSSDEYVSIDRDTELNEDNNQSASNVFTESTTSRNNDASTQQPKVNSTSEDELSDSNEDIECKHEEDCTDSGEDTSLNFDDILNEIHQIFVEKNSTIELMPGVLDNPENLNILNLFHSILKGHSNPTHGTIKTTLNQPNYLNILRGLITNIVKNNIVINNNIPVTPKPVDVIAEKDTPDDLENLIKSTEKPISEQNFKETTTENPKSNVTKENTSDLDQEDKAKNISSSTLASKTETTIIKNPEEIASHNPNDTDKLIQVNATIPPVEPESSSKGEEKEEEEGEKSATPNPNKIDNNTTNDKLNDSEIDKAVDHMLGLLNNNNFWKFLGDLGGKYLDSLMTHTSAMIREQVTAQVKKQLDALKHDEKLTLEREKDKTKNDKHVKESGNKISNGKNISGTLSINAHNLFGNTVGNDKVTNVYMFYANDRIDDIIQHIKEIVNKTKSESTHNIFTFVPNQLALNNETNEPTNISEVTTDHLKPTVNQDLTSKPYDVQKPTEPSTNDVEHPINVSSHTQTVFNCNSDQTHCDKIEVSTKPSVESDQHHNVTVHTTENIVESTTDGKKDTPEVTTTVVELIPEKVPITETTDKPTQTTENVVSKEPITENIVITTESDATKESTVAQVTSTLIQTESTPHSTGHSETTDSNTITESDTAKETTISDVTPLSTTERIEVVNHHNNETTLNSTSSEDDKVEVTTESMKIVTDNISSTTESSSSTEATPHTSSSIDSTESDRKDLSSTKLDEETNHISTEPSPADLSSDNSKKETNTESDNIKSTTEAVPVKATTVSEDHNDNKSQTELNNENNNSTPDHSVNVATTENSEPKTENKNETIEVATEKTTVINNVTDDNKITTESTKTDTDLKDGTESSTEKHEEAKT